MRKSTLPKGFTLVELITVVAIIAILGAVAVFGYQEYTTRAAAADLISRHHDIRTAVQAGNRSADNCADLAKGYGAVKLDDPYASLSFGFEAVAGGGYRPVLSVCARADQRAGTRVARRAHDTLAGMGVVEPKAVLTDSVVSYALRLTEPEQSLCKTAPPAASGNACTPPAQQTAAALVPPQPQAQAVTPQQIRPPTVQSLTQAVAQIPPAQIPARSPAQQAAVTAAVQNLVQGLSQASSPDDALAKTIAAAQSLPPETLTQSVPANTPEAKAVLAQCPALRFGQRPCRDNLRPPDSCARRYTTAQLTDCIPATVCPVSAGVCQGVTPEMRALLDASWQRMRTP